MKKVYLLSLGCPRNLTDSEVLKNLLIEKGYVLTESIENVDIAIVNTCGFISDAKEESINAILHLSNLKNEGKVKKIVVCGCLSQKYHKELVKEILDEFPICIKLKKLLSISYEQTAFSSNAIRIWSYEKEISTCVSNLVDFNQLNNSSCIGIFRFVLIGYNPLSIAD